MKIVIAGGSGCIGSALVEHYRERAEEIIILTRSLNRKEGHIQFVHWDGSRLGPWVKKLEGTDVLINLTGKSVNCRYTDANKREILSSRINATRILGEAVELLSSPPRIWIQASSATIYRHAEDRPMDEWNGEIGADFSMNVCKQWERAFGNLILPATKKVILRIGIVLSQQGGALPLLTRLVRMGAGGRQGSGNQYVSWVHTVDLIRVFDWIIHHPNPSSHYNCTAPNPIKNKLFMQMMRRVYRMKVGLPIPSWLLTLGAIVVGTETELILKSRWVLPVQLQKENFQFAFTHIKEALTDLAKSS